MKDSYDIVVVGAGAAGIIAAGRAAERGARVLLIEKMKQAGRKLLITGKGRCNISNDAPLSEYIKNIHPNGRYLKHAFARFFSADIVALLNKQGVTTTIERGNRIFPASNSAKDVVQGMLKWLQQKELEIRYETSAEQILVKEGEVAGLVINQKGREKTIGCKKVILCTGGQSYPATGSTGDGYRLARELGHTINSVRPALVPLVTEGDMASDLQGLSLRNVKAVLWINDRKFREEFGEMLFTHFGLSGPIILTLSRDAVDALRDKKQVSITIDLKPALNEEKLDARLLRDIDANGKKKVYSLCKLWLPSKLIPLFLRVLQIDGNKEAHQLSSKERKAVRILMKNLRFQVSGYRGFSEAIITAGGVDTTEVDNKSMESKIVNGLFFAGELLDLDGNTGGFNLQIAYSTGWLAAESAGDAL